jgi:pimeloyl-ACP methyl ester carboxylesterase
MARDVVLLHGFTHTGASWDPVVAAFAESYRALAPDIRGHGAASAREPVTLDGVLDDVAELAPESFTLVGYSMGGRIALHAALAAALRPRVERLILIGASPGLADRAERAARRAADERLADEVEHRRPCSRGSPPRWPRRSTPTAGEISRPGWRARSAASGPGRCHHCGSVSGSSASR